ncbi:cytochrome C [Neobacillus sp. OS1-32]|uniref:Cytochrome C n=1 Tax=Neobacillus paridis TaxID=2803862 RepID=A0ABS1TPV3_9BACI|nr:cytochrome C [Neobacillus sp. OS1-32]MBL4953208.1 cytochrome C [Neobacillus paridis]WML29708.1 cytochrome C [Neobacillus sp. OS1-32]
MKKSIISFVISLVIGFGLGYLVFDVLIGNSSHEAQTAQTGPKDKAATTEKSSTSTEPAAKTVAADEDNILNKKGCLGCHSVESLNLQGGQVGPDLSKAYVNVEGKHGKPIEEFLKKPTTEVMSGVIGKNPLTDQERKQVLELLKKASEK